MSWVQFGRMTFATVIALVASAGLVVAGQPGSAAQARGGHSGHTSDFSTPAGRYCVPGQAGCDSYDTPHWRGFSPRQIKSVTFANGSTANKWAAVSDFGGTAEVNQYCPSYGGKFGPGSTYCGTTLSPAP